MSWNRRNLEVGLPLAAILYKMPKQQTGIFLAVAVGATYLLYSSALGFPFVFDDQPQIAQNPHLSSWSYVPVYFTRDVWSHLPGPPGNLYRPFFLIWLRVNFILFAHNATGWHLTSLLLHLLATGLVYVLAQKLLHDAWIAVTAAFLFGIHPVHVEAVAWISGATEPLSTVLVLAALLCYLKSTSGLQQAVFFWRVMTLSLFALAILAKETAAMLPCLIFLYELAVAHQSTADVPGSMKASFARAGRRTALFLVPVAGYVALRAIALGGLLHQGGNLPFSATLLRWPWLFCSYVRLLVWPIKLSPLYDPISIRGWTDVRFWLPTILLVAGGFAVWSCRKLTGFRMAFFLIGWFLITLLPALVISSLARPWELFQDRYVYLPSVAFVILLAAGLQWLLRAGTWRTKSVAATAALVAMSALALASWKQIQHWQSNYALFNRANTIAPHNELAKLGLVHELIKYTEYARALQVAEEAASLDPQSARAQDSAAWSAFYLKDYALAERHWSASTRMDSSQARTWQYLGLSRIQLGNYEGAAAALERAIALDPKGLGLHYSRGIALDKSSQWDAAREEFRQELTIDPQNQQALLAYREAESHLRP